MSELPKGWVQCRLGDVLTLINGRAYNKDEMLSDPNSGVPILRIQNLNGGDNWFYSDLDLAEDKYCYKGDLLFAWSATFGPYWARWDKTIYHYHIWLIKPSTLLTKKFAFYVLQNITASIKAAAHGVAMPHMTKNGMENWSIGIPSPVQQTRIVEKLDEVLAQVDTIKARLDGIPAILKRFRQSVLAAAVCGRLTEEWRKKKENTPSQVVQLGSVISDITQGWSPKCENSSAPEGKWAVIKTSAVQKIEFLANENKLLPDELEPRQDLVVNPGDIIVTRAGPRVRCGVTAYVENTRSKLMLCDKVYRFTVKADLGVSKFLALILNAPQYLEEIEEMKTGSSDSGMNLTQKKFKELSVNWPSVDEQKEIVRLVEQYFSFADTIESQVKKAQTRVDNLTQSILAKAFRGELVAQDPNDEPAEKLLERIAQARKEAEALAKAAKKVAKPK